MHGYFVKALFNYKLKKLSYLNPLQPSPDINSPSLTCLLNWPGYPLTLLYSYVFLPALSPLIFMCYVFAIPVSCGLLFLLFNLLFLPFICFFYFPAFCVFYSNYTWMKFKTIKKKVLNSLQNILKYIKVYNNNNNKTLSSFILSI